MPEPEGLARLAFLKIIDIKMMFSRRAAATTLARPFKAGKITQTLGVALATRESALNRRSGDGDMTTQSARP